MLAVLSLLVLECWSLASSSPGWRNDFRGRIRSGELQSTSLYSPEVAFGRILPWGRPVNQYQQERFKKDSTDECDKSGKDQSLETQTLLKRLVGSIPGPVYETGRAEDSFQDDAVLVPWVEPFPENVEPLDEMKSLHRHAAARPKRGWEVVDMCGCCLDRENSPCCRMCLGNRKAGAARPLPPKPVPQHRSDKKHVRYFIRSTMCMCCDRAQLDSCCDLCEKIEKLWCC